MGTLSKFITRLTHQFDKKLVLLIDEVDASSNFDPFLSFLGMLRTKYLGRTMPNHRTFHSIILAGVYDIKNLKYKLHNPDDAQANSPWNIAADFKVDMSFHPNEIATMLEQYCREEGKRMDIPAIAERLHYHTAGYPFLVSRLCKITAEEILPGRMEKTKWTLDDIEEAVQALLKEENTNFESLIKNLENNKKLYDLVFRIVMEGDTITFNPDNPLISIGTMYGVFKRNGEVKIHNRVYEQRIYNYMASKVEVELTKASHYNYNRQFWDGDHLNVVMILEKFQLFMQSEYSDKDQPFLEREWRLIFLAFIRPIVNGRGYTFKETEISEEKRLDVTITFFQHKYIVELKRWYGEKVHQEGINQLCDYLNRQNLTKGFLVIFEHRTKKTWRKETIRHDGKEIFAVWV